MTRREEFANALTHGVGLLCALVAAPILIVSAAGRGEAAGVVGSSVFAATVILLYLASTAYHAAREGRLKARLRQVDHAAIYLLIAGTYTPFTLGVLRGPLGWTLFGVVWGVAILGVLFKLTVGIRLPRASTVLYLLLGWLAIVALRPLLSSMPIVGFLWLAAGGVAYTAGVGFYCARRLPYAHCVWHLFVLAGTACHFFAVLRYSA